MKKEYIIGGILLLIIVIGWKNYIPKFNSAIDVESFSDYDVTVYRDTWGVPHIFGEKDKDTAYGLGYAHSEDDFKTIQDILLALRGKMATVHGKDAAANDYMVQLLRIRDVVENNYDYQLSDDVKAVCESYADGMNHYAVRHPDEVARGLFPVSGKDIVTGFVHRTPLMFGLDRVLGKLASEEKPDFAFNPEAHEWGPFDQTLLGSNVVAVAPRRSADKHTRIAINSHQPWTGPVAWYEAHLHSEEGWNMNGGLFPGSPVIFLGHNENLGWSHTVNQPDLIDVYELEIHPEDENKYFIQGKWEELEVRDAPITVKLWGPFKWTFKRETLWSVHGPVIRNPYGAYAVRFVGFGEVRHVEQWFRMNKSRNLEEFGKAMSMHALPMFNTAYADKNGNLYYVYNALLPIRGSDNYDWEGIVPGNTAYSLWRGYFGFDNLPQVVNPQSGFIQNCNSTPFLASIGTDNPDGSFYPRNLGIEMFQTNRALRAHETFGADESITREEFYNYKFDTKYSEKSVMGANLRKFMEEASSEDPDVQDALALLRNWDLDTDSSSTAMHLAYDAIRPRSDPADYNYDYGEIMARLEKTVKETKEQFGKLDVKWGDIHRLRRGKTDLALSGGPDILRAIYSREKNGVREGRAGDCYFEIVEWDTEGNVSAQSIHQFGSATRDTNSVHYDDQAKLFAKHQMKPVWMTLEDIKLNLEKAYRPGEE
ncbi:MAG: acylase [Candidatus Marinimicrobia bacterium]|jgi:penicillin amidase/acyl-homoserine-lactone acylase|nr:acylase [Candidatus Neomarinimicrobiota bacterium]|tara:strand:- start:14623 stop:16746 length:2124 start_codon:yes stop_codon:yes gene_type:complete